MRPLTASPLLKTSDGGKLLAPAALGTSRLLWDVEDEPKTLNDVHNAEARNFVDAALDYLVDTAGPKGGRNAHVDHGGKRGPAGAPPLLVRATSPVETPKARTWALYSKVDLDGHQRGTSTVLFQPSRIAGDSYRVTVYMDIDGSLDQEAPGPLDVPHADRHRTSTGELVVMRVVQVERYYRKKASITPVKLATVVGNLEPCGIVLDDSAALPTEFPPSYHQHVQ